MTADERLYKEPVAASDVDTAHSSEQPFAYGAFRIMIQRGDTSLCSGALPRFPNRRCTRFSHKEPSRHPLIFKQSISVFNIDIRQHIKDKRRRQETGSKPPAVVVKRFHKPLFGVFLQIAVDQLHIKRSDELCLPVSVKGIALVSD